MFNDLGVMGALRSDWPHAKEHLDSAVSHNPTSPIILNNLGNYLVCQGYLDSAVSQYRQALSLDSAFRAPLYNWAVASYLAGQTDDAVEKMQHVLGYLPQDPGLRSVMKVDLEDIDIRKGDPSKLSQLEILRLLDLARARRDSAVVRSQNAVDSTDTLPPSVVAPAEREEITPAGGKAAMAKDLAASLYWITYATAGRPSGE